jgi:hypothetical protein
MYCDECPSSVWFRFFSSSFAKKTQAHLITAIAGICGGQAGLMAALLIFGSAESHCLVHNF